MKFGGVRYRANDQERILDMSLVQNGGFIKACMGTGPVGRKSCYPGPVKGG